MRGAYKLMTQLHYPTDIISHHNIAAGELTRYRVLLLPLSRHLRPETAQRIAEFVRAGGILIAEYQAGASTSSTAKRIPSAGCWAENRSARPMRSRASTPEMTKGSGFTRRSRRRRRSAGGTARTSSRSTGPKESPPPPMRKYRPASRTAPRRRSNGRPAEGGCSTLPRPSSIRTGITSTR